MNIAHFSIRGNVSGDGGQPAVFPQTPFPLKGLKNPSKLIYEQRRWVLKRVQDDKQKQKQKQNQKQEQRQKQEQKHRIGPFLITEKGFFMYDNSVTDVFQPDLVIF